MPGTPKSQRAAPPRRFENYVLTRVVDPSAGVTNIPDTAFTQLSGNPDYTGFNIGQGFCDDGISFPTAIGFDFQLDGITYKQFAACVNGWVALVDPHSGSFNASEVIGGSVWQNPTILPTFGSNAVLLAPWFDDLRNVANVASQLESSPTSFSATKVDRITKGLEPPPTQYNQVAYGVSYYNDVRARKGRRLVIRWNCLSNFASPSTVLKFEVVLYENGTIEYRYVPRSALALQSSIVEGATIGVFMPNGTSRFRDFAVGLGYRDFDRTEYIYGGFPFTGSYIDSETSGQEDFPMSASYTINLKPFQHWPGGDRGGSVFSFSPPVSKRKVLPRAVLSLSDARQSLPLVARTGDSRLGTGPASYDDRRSPVYASTLSGAAGLATGIPVSYPTTSPRFFGGTALGTLERQDLFAGDFLVTGSIVKSAIEPYVLEQPERAIDAFSEVSRFDQLGPTNVVTSSFFSLGSDPRFVGAGLDQQLKSKTQVKVSLLVDVATTMPDVTSSIFYYNMRAKAWNVPINSTYLIPATGTTPPIPTLPAGGDWQNPRTDARNGRVLEDGRGFGAFGQILGSGSHTPGVLLGDQTDSFIGLAGNGTYTPQNAVVAMQRSLLKSVRNNSDYRPSPDESFTLPITSPFLIEKAVIELPFSAGPGWFNDQTRTFNPDIHLFGLTSYDVGGPAVTVALMRQVQECALNDSSTRRDLILTGTFTHTNDYVSGVVLDSAPPVDTNVHINPIGFLSYANPAAGVVQPAANNTFTGSVQLQCTALASAGVVVQYLNHLTDTASNNAAAAKNVLINVPVLTLTNSNIPGASQGALIASIAPFGRGGTGFAPSGRSVFGNEHVSFQGLSDVTGRTVKNPFYVGPNGLTPQQSAALASPSGSFVAYLGAAIPLITSFPSPYLVMPGDKLVLSVSKRRPYVFTTNANQAIFSGSAHDVVLMPGAINITLYGSLLQQGVEFHDTLNQSLGSNAIHELVAGAEPVLDQFDVPYRGELSGSYVDNAITGSLNGLPPPPGSVVVSLYGRLFYNVNGRLFTYTNVADRGRAYSILNARNAPVPDYTGSALTSFPLKSQRLQPAWERAGDIRSVSHTDFGERYFDSMCPAFNTCMAADGTGITKLAASNSDANAQATFSDVVGDYQRIDVGSFNSSTISNDPTRTHPGYIFFDGFNLGPSLSIEGGATNLKWNSSFPFEPRYAAAARQLSIQSSLLATLTFNGSVSSSPIAITPERINGLLLWYAANAQGEDGAGNPSNIVNGYWLGDVDLSVTNPFSGAYYSTGSLDTNGLTMALYGFGDTNNCNTTHATFGHGRAGANHLATWRDTDVQQVGYGEAGNHPNTYRFGQPNIRGWRRGLVSGLPTYSKLVYRRDRFGQLRDCLEQRLDTKWYNIPEGTRVGSPGTAVVNVKFIDPVSGQLVDPASTWSFNQSFECTSSLPFFDGLSVDRPPINTKALNTTVVSLSSDAQGNVTL